MSKKIQIDMNFDVGESEEAHRLLKEQEGSLRTFNDSLQQR